MQTLVITDGRMGNVRQAEALAYALGAPFESITIHLGKPWRWIAPRGARFVESAIDPGLCARVRDSQDAFLVIGCGRSAAFVTRGLRELAPSRVFAIQILDPRIDPQFWNLVIAPLHDELRASNVLNCVGALNRIDDALLAKAAREFPELKQMPMPRTAVLLGGSNRAQRIDQAYVDALFAQLSAQYEVEGGSWLITTSRRTDPNLVKHLQGLLHHRAHRLWTNEASDGPNPYLGYLAHAQRIVVTPDSVNLIAEACATGKPVFCHTQAPVQGKLKQFHAELLRSGHLHPLGERVSIPAREPLRETAAIAAVVKLRWQAWQAEHLV